MLIQLPNGQWINPESVTGVVVDEAGSGNVRVSAPTGWIDIAAGLDAEQMRDRIAESVNAACYEARR